MKQSKTKINSGLTIRELAKRCDTSISTISRVLNGNYNPHKPSHQRVKQMLDETGYKRQKRVNTVRNILCASNIVPIEGTHKLQLERSLEKQAPGKNFSLVISHSHEPEHLERLVKEHNIKGIILNGVPLQKPSVPTVLINQDYCLGDYSSVNCDDLAGLIMILRHLKENGHRRIAYFCRTGQDSFRMNPRQCLGYKAFEAAEVEFDEKFFFRYNSAEVDNHIEEIISLRKRPTAIVLAGDCYAKPFYEICYRKGIKIPDDISITGFDDDPLSALMSPPLTTVRKSIDAMARKALMLLDEAISGNETICNIFIKPELIIRNSVKKGKRI